MVSLAWLLLAFIHCSDLSPVVEGRLAEPVGRAVEALSQVPQVSRRPASPEAASTADHGRLTTDEAAAEKATNARVQVEREFEEMRQKQEARAREAKKREELKEARMEAEAQQRARFAALAKERENAEARQAMEREQRLDKERHQELKYLDRLSAGKKRREVGKFQREQSKLDRLVVQRKKEDLLQGRQREAERERKASSILDALDWTARDQIEEVRQAARAARRGGGPSARLAAEVRQAARAARRGGGPSARLAAEAALDQLPALAASLASSSQLKARFAGASRELQDLSSHYVQQVLEKQETFLSFVHDANKDLVALTAKLFNDTLGLESSHASGVNRIRRSLTATLPGHLEQPLQRLMAPLELAGFTVPGFSYRTFTGTPASEVCPQATEFLRSAAGYEQALSNVHHQFNLTAQVLAGIMPSTPNASEAQGDVLQGYVRLGYVEILARKEAMSGLTARVSPAVVAMLHCEWSAARGGRRSLGGFAAAAASILWILREL